MPTSSAIMSHNSLSSSMLNKRKSHFITANCSSDGDLRDTSYAQYGVSSRKLMFRTSGSKECIVLCRGWPSWFWAAHARGLVLRLAVLQEGIWSNLIKHFSPSTEVLVWGEQGEVDWPVVDMVFSDFTLKGNLRPILNHITQTVVTLKAICGMPSTWCYHKVVLRHVHCGGVTDGQWPLHTYSSCPRMELVTRIQAHRDMSTITDSMVSSGVPCRPHNLSDKRKNQASWKYAQEFFMDVVYSRGQTYRSGPLFQLCLAQPSGVVVN
jgi:hypothetical protein